jgi:hypothetical protein
LFVSRFRTRFFVRHNITFRVVGCSCRHITRSGSNIFCIFFRRDKLWMPAAG